MDKPGPDLVSLDEEDEKEWLWSGRIDVMIEARERDDGVRPSLIDLDAFREMVKLHEYILNITVDTPSKVADMRRKEGLDP